MTPKERMYSAIARKPVDRFPFSTYNCHPFAWGSHRDDPAYASILRMIEETSAGCLCKTSARSVSNGARIETEQRVEGSDTYTTSTWHTPKGPLTQMTRKPADQPSMCVKHYIADEGDVDRVMSVPHAPAEWDATGAVANAREVGDKGVAYLSYGDPFHHTANLFDQEDFAIRTVTEFEMIRSLVAFHFERLSANLKGLLDALVPFDVPFLFYTGGPERACPPLLPPKAFKELVTPYQKRLVALIHEYGYPVSLHCHGRVKEVFPYVLESGFDVLEPIEPPPQGNIDLEELRRAADGKMALMGYVQDQEFYSVTEDEMRGRVRAIAELVGETTGCICAPTCTPFQHPPTDTYVTNYLAFLDEAEKAGRRQ